MAVKPRGSGYQVDVVLNGKRHRPQFPTEAEALTWESEAKLAARLGKAIPPVVIAGEAKGGGLRTLSDLLEITIKQEWHGRRSEAKLSRNGEMFVEWAGPKRAIDEVDEEMLMDYTGYLRKLGNSNATINRKMAAVKVMFKVARRRRAVSDIPYAKQLQESEASSNYLDFNQEDPILAHLMHRGYAAYYDLVIFLIDTGARIGEALKLDYDSVRNGRVTFEPWSTKNKKPRTIPLTSRALLALERRRQAGSHPSRPFGDIRYDHLRRTLRSVFDHLGGRFADITQPLHVFRHSCASRLAIRGVDVNRIRAWMDHSSIVTTQRYIKLAPKDLEDVVSALEDQKPKLRRVK